MAFLRAVALEGYAVTLWPSFGRRWLTVSHISLDPSGIIKIVRLRKKFSKML
jgi:hypothetical protein